MSKFNHLAVELDDLAKAAIKEYNQAADRLEAARRALNDAQAKAGMNAETAARAEVAKAEFNAAEKALRDVQRKMDDGAYRQQVAQIRQRLADEVRDAYQADPSKIDTNTLELLKSGILTPGEYAALLEKAYKDNNPTMARMIGKYAADAAAVAVEKANGYMNDPTALALRAVSYDADKYSGQQVMTAFGRIAEVYDYVARHPAAMAGKWEDLTAEMIEAF